MVQIRNARPEDSEAIAHIHVDAWRSAFADIVPAGYLEQLDYTESRDLWRQLLTQPGARTLLVAADTSAAIIGFVLVGPPRWFADSFDAELQGIYVAPRHQRRGVGRALLQAAAAQALAAGQQSLLVWTLADSPYRRFYERFGARQIARDEVEFDGEPRPVVIYAWEHLGSAHAQFTDDLS